MNIKELIITTLNNAFNNYPVFQLGTIEESEELPENYFTFRIDSSESRSFDNDDALTAWDININFFTNDPNKTMTVPNEMRQALKEAGFIPQGRGYDLISDNSDYSGWYSDYYYLERNKKEV